MNNFLQEHIKILEKKFINPELELRVLLKNSLIKNKEIIFSNFNINDINLSKFNYAFERRIKNEPTSKIFNIKSFWKYDFFVNEDVLDPRPETEIIIESVIKLFPTKNKKLKILDMFTGSGCLAISLAKEYPNSSIVATDISKRAIEIAKINAKKLSCNNQINFKNCNLINEILDYDIITANPPYLSEEEYSQTSKEIQLFEPKIAFIASEDGYEYYNKIAKILPSLLNKNSRAFIEIGLNQAEKTTNIFESNNINCLKVVKDLQNFNRVLILNKT